MTLGTLVEKLLHEECRPDIRVRYGEALPGAVAHRCPDVGKLSAIGWKAEVKL